MSKKLKIKFGIVIAILGFCLLIIALLMNFWKLQSSIEDELTNFTVVPSKKSLDCMTCHTKQVTFRAKDTINQNTCNNCHKEDVEFLVPVGAGVHNFHKGNISLLPSANYIERHKEDIAVSCDACHIFVSTEIPDCRQCHKGNDHVSRTDKACSSCHGYLNELFKHNSINLVTHDKFGQKSCSAMCHSDDRVSLRLINNVPISIADSSRLCKQCHYGVYNDWAKKSHFSVQTCTDCHNPHDPESNLSKE